MGYSMWQINYTFVESRKFSSKLLFDFWDGKLLITVIS